MKKILCYAMLCGGVLLLLMGAREVLEPWFFQAVEERTWSAGPPAQPIRLGGAIARLSIPRLDSQWYVMEGTGRKELRRGPGHLVGTALPGNPGNCVIAGHRDTQFRVLAGIHRGDDIILQTRRGEYLYRVTQISVVAPSNTAPVGAADGYKLHLITCYPFYYAGEAPERFVVQAELAQAWAFQASPQPPRS